MVLRADLRSLSSKIRAIEAIFSNPALLAQLKPMGLSLIGSLEALDDIDSENLDVFFFFLFSDSSLDDETMLQILKNVPSLLACRVKRGEELTTFGNLLFQKGKNKVVQETLPYCTTLVLDVGEYQEEMELLNYASKRLSNLNLSIKSMKELELFFSEFNDLGFQERFPNLSYLEFFIDRFDPSQEWFSRDLFETRKRLKQVLIYPKSFVGQDEGEIKQRLAYLASSYPTVSFSPKALVKESDQQLLPLVSRPADNLDEEDRP